TTTARSRSCAIGLLKARTQCVSPPKRRLQLLCSRVERFLHSKSRSRRSAQQGSVTKSRSQPYVRSSVDAKARFRGHRLLRRLSRRVSKTDNHNRRLPFRTLRPRLPEWLNPRTSQSLGSRPSLGGGLCLPV